MHYSYIKHASFIFLSKNEYANKCDYILREYLIFLISKYIFFGGYFVIVLDGLFLGLIINKIKIKNHELFNFYKKKNTLNY